MCYTSQHSDILFLYLCECFKCHGRKLESDDTDFDHSPPFIRKFPFFPLYTLLATAVRPGKKYKIAPKLGKNNRNFLRATLITLRASSYSPLYDIKSQDDLLRQGN